MKKTNVLLNNKGFTMVEMLVVIILIGFVVSFLFNYAGNAFSNAASQQAASKIADDMRIIGEAASRYTMEKATQANGLGTAATELGSVSIQSGSPFLSSIPNQPTTGTTANEQYTWVDSITGFGNAANADGIISLSGILSKEVCQQINSQFAGAAPGAGTAIPAGILYTKDLQCYGAGPYTASKPIYIN